MALSFKGFVLRPPRIAQSNAATTSAATSGVVRDSKPVPSSSSLTSPDLVDSAAVQYRTAILNPEGESEEYLVFAANTSNLTILEDTILQGEATGNIVTGTGEVLDTTISPERRKDGSDRVVAIDNGNRNILEVISFDVTRGDTGVKTSVTFSGGDYTFNTTSGILTLSSTIVGDPDNPGLGPLDGGVSNSRGDNVGNLVYKLASARFWWTKNDEKETRFNFNGAKQRWEPLKGSTPINLDLLAEDGEYILTPNHGIVLGQYLPGDSSDPDVYSMLRIGVNPGTAGVPIAEPPVGGFGGVFVVDDALVSDFDFSSNPTDSAVIGVLSGELKWNPAYIAAKAGQLIWYAQRSYQEGESGLIGKLLDVKTGPLFIAPIPASTDYPFIQIGSRKPLDPILVETEADLLSLVLSTGQVGIALSTGRLGFNSGDVDRADPDAVGFDIAYLGANIVHCGVSLVQEPQPVRSPAALVNSGGSPDVVGSGDLFVPDSLPLFGLGVSGVLSVPDTSGAIPNTGGTPGLRINDSGLVRELGSIGDLIVFTPSGVFDRIEIVDFETDFPKFEFQIRKGSIYIARTLGTGGSKVKLGTKDLSRFDNESIYLLQADIVPSLFYVNGTIKSRIRDSYTLVGEEKLRFAVNGDDYLWDASIDPGGVITSAGGVFTAAQIATSLQGTIIAAGGDGEAVVVDSRVTIRVDLPTDPDRFGEVEIGYGPSNLLDLSGPSALGFLPGSFVKVIAPGDPENVHYVPDSGASLGMFRSSINLDRNLPIPDFKNRARFEEEIFSASVIASQVQFLTNVPLEDEAGFDEGVFFELRDGTSFRKLVNFEQVFYQFQGDSLATQPKFSWADTFSLVAQVTQPTQVLDLGRQFVIPDTLHQNVGGGLLLSEDGGALVQQDLGEDFLLDLEGLTGQATLVDVTREFVTFGGNASFTAGGTTFTDGTPGLDFVTLGVQAGYKLKTLSGDSQGYYSVTSVTGPSTLEVAPMFPTTSVGVTSWELYVGVDTSVVDAALIADQFYTDFNHLAEEVFIINSLDLLGTVPTSEGDQIANRLRAVVADAVASDREIGLRYSLPSVNAVASLAKLQKIELGTIVNGSLFVPDAFPASNRFTDNAYSIQVGTDLFTFTSGKLILLATINDPVAADSIGVLKAGAVGDGELKFGDDLLVDYQSSTVNYVEDFLSPSLLTALQGEINIDTGDINLPSSDLNTFGGQDAYFLEKMVSDGGVDVTINPISGGVFFTKPLRAGQIVEANYFLATASGVLKIDRETGLPVKVVEFLSISVSLERATPISSTVLMSNQFNFNVEGKTVFQEVVPQVFVNGILIGFLGNGTVTFDFDTNILTLEIAVNSTDNVQISYFILEALGGEAAYSVSTPPVFRPPFNLKVGENEFVLETDRTNTLNVGDLFRVGAAPFYIVSATYDAGPDLTTVRITPTPVTGVGSLSPGNDALAVVSVDPVSTTLSGAARAGFFSSLGEYEPITKNATNIVFFGNVTEFAVIGHLLEIADTPFIIGGVSFDDAASKTTVELTSPTPRAFTFPTDSSKISVRPVYSPNPTEFLGRGPVLTSEPFDAVIFGGKDENGAELPGQVIRLGIDYNLDEGTGAITFLAPSRGPLIKGETLYFFRTDLRVLAPLIVGGVPILPRYKAGYTHKTDPSEQNGYLGKTLVATFTFSNPDSFYFRLVPLTDYLGEVAKDLNQSVAANTPSNGPVAAVVGGGQENFEGGNFGLDARLVDLQNTDRSARHFVSFYNDTIVSFEQIQETISGIVIGDRDGKFRFFHGLDKDFAPPGYEDPYSGNLNHRNIYSQVFGGLVQSFQIEESDPIVDPKDATLVGGQVFGSLPDADTLDTLIRDQELAVRNDIDDIVLIGLQRIQVKIPPLFFPDYFAFGRYRKMGEAHILSRLFPERSNAFSVTSPGIGADLNANDPGVYARSRFADGKTRSTSGKSIATISNPVLNVIEDVSSVGVTDRRSRARIFAYSKDGFPDLDTALGTTTAGKQTVIATPLLLKDFPVDSNTGLPDVSQLQSQGGTLIDLDSGDPELFTPPFLGSGGRVTFGKPTGTVLAVGADSLTSPNLFGFEASKSIFVDEIQVGCVIIFNEGSTVMTSGDAIIVIGADGVTGDPVELEKGDTIFLSPPDVEITTSDPPTAEEMEEIAAALPGYRVGFDVGLDRKSGELVDRTYRSFRDPTFLGFKELFGQKPPAPVTMLDMVATYRNSNVELVQIPALLGQTLNDDGDFSIPYLSLTNTEITRLQTVAPLVTDFFLDTPIPSAVYPDEILANDGEVIGVLTGSDLPAELLVSKSTTPVVSGGGYVPNSGIGDLQSYDFLFVESGQSTVPIGSQGILSIGRVTGTLTSGTIEPPRFITQSFAGSTFQYDFSAAMTYINQPAGRGIVIDRSGISTTFDIATVLGDVIFNDGVGVATTGGLNDILSPSGGFVYPGNDNIIRINLFDPNTSGFLQTVELRVQVSGVGPEAFGDASPGGVAINSQPLFSNDDFVVVTNFPIVTITLTPTAGQLPEDPGNVNHTIPLWFTIDIFTNTGALAASTTGNIGEDRLTFFESYDLRSVLERSTPTLGGQAVHGRLNVTGVDSDTGNIMSVNSVVEMNGSSFLTFVNRNTAFPFIGTFSSSVGTIRVMGWEGHSNTAITTTGTDLVFSGIPSSDQDENGIICKGVGFGESRDVVSTPIGSYADFDSRVVIDTVISGDLDNIEVGDVVAITKGESSLPIGPFATSKAGTYLVRYHIKGGGLGYRVINPVTKAIGTSSEDGFANARYPVINTNNIVTSLVVNLTFVKIRGQEIFPTTGRLYFIPDISSITSVISVEYSSFNPTTNDFTLVGGTFEDADGGALTDAPFGALPPGTMVSGFQFFVVRYKNALDISPEMPSDYLVGYRGDSTYTFAEDGTAHGFRDFTLQNPGLATSVVFPYVQIGGANTVKVGNPSASGVGIKTQTPIDWGITTGRDSNVYNNTPNIIDLSAVDQTQWDTLHGNTAGASEVNCVFPGDELTGTIRLQEAIFLEPSIPKTAADLAETSTSLAPRIVESGHTLNATEVGFRNSQAFGRLGNPAPGGIGTIPESIDFTVRRIRRFHDVQSNLSSQMEGLSFAYEIRTGVVTSFGSGAVSGGSWPYVLVANDATTLGDFDNLDVGINPGDLLRILDSSGDVVDTAEVAAVLDSNRLKLAAPGLVELALYAGLQFQVFLKTAPVPHEQSNEELLDLMTEENILNVIPNYVNEEGGLVPTINNLQDNSGGSLRNFESAGAAVGDIVLIDPQGAVQGPTGLPATGQESGQRPFGDTSVQGRTPYVSGRPAELDDNRGYYFIESFPTPDTMEVSGVGDFGADVGNDVIFGTSTDTKYAVYPTITSLGNEEGQVDLRITALSGTNGSSADSFRDNFFSIEPFGYRIIRPSGLFSRDAQELILFMRERMLSWIEELGSLLSGTKDGDYQDLQQDLHIHDLGDPNDPNTGLGVTSNALIIDLLGLTNVSPFANASDCLSILDRRFWILDLQLDTQKPPGAGGGDPTYSAFETNVGIPAVSVGEGRPVLPDRISEILDNVDQFRELRLSWIDFRTNVKDGTLSAIERFLLELPSRKREAARLLLQNRSLESL